MKSEVRVRSQLVAVRLTPDEKAKFTAFADRLGRSLPDLMRLAVEAAMLQESAATTRSTPQTGGANHVR